MSDCGIAEVFQCIAERLDSGKGYLLYVVLRRSTLQQSLLSETGYSTVLLWLCLPVRFSASIPMAPTIWIASQTCHRSRTYPASSCFLISLFASRDLSAVCFGDGRLDRNESEPSVTKT